MIFRQILNDDLACASYLLADGGDAAVVDPAWEIEPYLSLAQAHGLTIRHVLETHVHADHLSGLASLTSETGATAYLPSGVAGRGHSRLLRDGDVVRIGRVKLETVATPGHRPEHVSFLVTDSALSDEPCFLLSGDSLLVGDVARPDLAADDDAEIKQAARSLFHSLRRLSALPDHVELWPGHIGGSLCGAAGVTGRVSSTIGFERRTNPGFELEDEDQFVTALIERVPERPSTVEVLVQMNRDALAGSTQLPKRLSPHEVHALVVDGALIVDGRVAEAFDALSIPGSLSIPLVTLGLGSRAAWFADPDDPIVAVAGDDERALQVAGRLRAAGLRNVSGFLGGGLGAWWDAGFSTAASEQVDLVSLARLIRDDMVTLVDLRDDDEVELLHVPGALHLPWREIPRRGHEAFESGRPIVVACATGRRTPLAASALRRLGSAPVLRVAHGGIAELAECGVTLERAVLSAP